MTTVTAPLDIPAILHADAACLIGPAGTGKTTLARRLVQEWPGTVLAATTGIASVNLGEGTTINALLRYFDTASLVESYTAGFLTAQFGKLWKAGVRRIILDEVSMLDAEQLTCFARALDELAGRRYVTDVAMQDEITDAQDQEEDRAEDGLRRWPIKLLLTGDWAQLPPVKAPFAFESPEWERFGAHAHLLTTIYRQTDPAFLEALWAARRGDPDPVCDYFGGRLASSTQHDFEGVTLFARNEEVDRYNRLRLDRVTGTAETYTPTRWGAQRGDWKNIPDALTLKVGATVMILANKREEEGDLTLGARLVYANGDLGVVTDLTRMGAWVQLHRTGEAVLVDPVTRRNEIPLEPGRREALRADGHPERIRDKFEVIGAVTYLPLRIAYGTTIHKCQGLTLDTVQINTRDHFFRTPGMAYVSLSRCRTPEGIRLVGTVDGLRRGVTVHPKLRGWI